MNGPKEQNRAGVAAVLSFIFTGLGQLYNGQIKKGLCLVALATTGIACVLLGTVGIAVMLFYGFFSWMLVSISLILFIVGIVIICAAGIYSIFDAYQNAA